MTKAVDEVLISLRRIIRATDIHSRQLVKSSGLTSPQILLLQTLMKVKEMPVGELAECITLSQATVTAIIDRLEQRGLVQRIRATSDRRKVLISLTEQGTKAINQAPEPLQQHFIRQFEALEQWEQTQILSVLQRVAKMMDADQIDASPYLELGPLTAEARGADEEADSK
jgi:DNA-binding MarR family transcriptional regulator